MKQLRKVRCVDKTKMRALITESFGKMGVAGKPIGAQELQEQIAARGVKSEDNAFSREIVGMREG